MTEKSSKRWLTPVKIVRTAPDRGDPAKAAEGQGVTHRRSGRAARVRTRRPEPTHVHAGQTDLAEAYGQPHCNVQPPLFIELPHQRLRILPVPPENKPFRAASSPQEEIRREVIALQDMGHKRLALEAGEDPRNN